MSTTVRFWGVRGSVPTSLTGNDIREKGLHLIERYRAAGCPEDAKGFIKNDPEADLFTSTYGGATSCVEVVADKERFVLDMGTGLRPLGNSLLSQMKKDGGLKITFCLSHVHWDHIQGLPFFAPLYVNKRTGIKNRWLFLGGTDWQKTAEVCLRGQMDPPVFPVSWKEILALTYKMNFCEVYDLMAYRPQKSRVTLSCRKLNHPQETYGWRVEDSEGKIVTYTTDNEPYDPRIPDPKLVSLAQNADVWITDCQYTREVYHGIKNGLPRYGWGHSYPDAVVATAIQAGVRKIVLFHHDPNSSDLAIKEMEAETQRLLKMEGKQIEVVAAREGMELIV